MISILAPARGATVQFIQDNTVFRDFNPRSREGSDMSYEVDTRDVVTNFNPRSREGSDQAETVSKLSVAIFQSSLPRGERQNTEQYKDIKMLISILAPARGATLQMESIGT